MSRRLATALLVISVSGLWTDLLAAQAKRKVPLTPAQERATAAIHEYFRRSVERLAKPALANVKTVEDWNRARPRLRQELLEMLGLWPIPPKTDLKATITGTVERADFIVEKLHFQSRPGLYVTANFYRPKKVDKPLPTILYVCGHGRVKIGNISYGNKATYQHHGAWFAREGYCCLIIDTLQLGEIEGIHHGTYREKMWWWLCRGYTSAGVEAWNAVRALDYLQTRPEVDKTRIGVTGRSGGGIYTWWLAAIDDRPACLVPVAGITDLENYVVDDCIEGHCDCMFMVNTYGWDFPTVAALAAPRPVLFSNSDKDTIFPLNGVVRTHAKIKDIFALYRAPDKLGLLITEGPHRDTQELQVPAFRWMNRWLMNKDEPIRRVADKPLQPEEVRVFQELPADQINTKIEETFVPAAEVPPPPSNQSEWSALAQRFRQELLEKSLRGWPQTAPPLDLRRTGQRQAYGLELSVYDFASDENLRIGIYVVRAVERREPGIATVTVVDQAGWEAWAATYRTAFPNELPAVKDHKPDPKQLAEDRRKLAQLGGALVIVPPRGVGPGQWDPDERESTHIRRRFVLVGKTEDEGRIWDVRRAVAAMGELDVLRGSRVRLEGRGSAAGLALYAAIFEPTVERVDLSSPTTTHRDGPYLLNVLRIFDLPQAAALVFPRKLVLRDTDPGSWQWTKAIAQLGGDPAVLQFRNGQPSPTSRER